MRHLMIVPITLAVFLAFVAYPFSKRLAESLLGWAEVANLTYLPLVR